MRAKTPSSRAFTLIEIFAAVSIVVVLAALLFPMVKRSQMSARSAACMGNLKNIGAAFQMYAADNGGLLPAPRYRSSSVGSNPNPTSNNWQFEIDPYLDINEARLTDVSGKAGGQAIFCPEYIKEFRSSAEAQKLKCAGYGMAPMGPLRSYDSRTALASVEKPSGTVLVGDSDNYDLYVDSLTWKQPGASGRYSSGDPVRHGLTANYLFVDGHISALTQVDAEAILVGR